MSWKMYLQKKISKEEHGHTWNGFARESLNFSPGQKWVIFNIADFLSSEVSVRILISCLKEERLYSKYTWHSGVNWIFDIKMRPFILRGADDLSNHSGAMAFCQKNINFKPLALQWVLACMLSGRSPISATGNSSLKSVLCLFCMYS